MDHQRKLSKQRRRRTLRVRKRVRGTPERPRLSVMRSHKHISAQIIDDLAGKTLVCVSTQSEKMKYGGNRAAAQTVGKVLAERAVKAGISDICFDRGRFKFHGRLAALADAAREGGLKF